MNKLSKYNAKREFSKTKEPKGHISKTNKKLKFVVQHHLARKDHYDFRIEYNGSMPSWAIPKGPSYNPKDKRLAIKVEDHPLSYRNFEGIIPKGLYGGGTVMIWDEGYWEPITKYSTKKAFKFILYGHRLKGIWNLIPFKEDNWLLVKENDKVKIYSDIKKINTSIKSNKTMEEISQNIQKINVTSPNKIIFNSPKITKKMIFDYYQKVGPRMLPYIENRLFSAVRSPNGIDNQKFYKKHFENIQKFLGKKIIKNKNGNKEDYYYIKDINGLLSEVQMNSFEFHIWDSKINSIEKPDVMVFDLDPDQNLDISNIRQGVKDLKSILDELKIKSYLKTSGGKGYHIVAKITSPNWNKHRTIAKNIALLMEQKWPDKYTSNVRKNKRKGKIFIDWMRNTKSATSVAPYSLRVKETAAVSMPIKWSELDKIKPDDIKIKDAIKRIKRKDPWSGLIE